MRHLPLICCAIGCSLLFLFGSCGTKRGDHLRYIPADASTVLTLTPQNLFDKANWGQLREEPFVEVFGENLGAAGLRFLRSPDSSGIDLQKPLYLATRFQPNDIEKVTYILALPLADATRFVDFVSALGVPNVQTDVLMSLRFAEETHFLKITPKAAVYVWGSSVWKPWAEDLLDGKLEGIAGNADFESATQSGHDVVLWTSSEQMANDKTLQTGLAMVGLDSALLHGNHPLVFADFREGIAQLGLEYRLSAGAHELLDPMFKDAPSTDFSAFVPREKLLALLTFAPEPEALASFLAKNPETTGLFVDDLLKPFGLQHGALLGYLQGDMFVAVLENNAKQESPDVLFGAACKTEAGAAQLLETIRTTPSGQNIGKFWRSDAGIWVGLSGATLFASTNPDILGAAVSGGASPAERLDASVWQQISGVAGLHLSPRPTLRWLTSDDENGVFPLDSLSGQLTGVGILVKRRSLEASVRFKDVQGNGLFQLLSLLGAAIGGDAVGGDKNLEDLMREEGL